MTGKAPKFASEADLCAAFIAAVKEDHRGGEWTAYPETEGWDILLAHRDGLQVGIQAKLALNAKVVDQALPGWTWVADTGPDHRAVLVPSGATGHMAGICNHLGITVIRQDVPGSPGAYGRRWNILPRPGHDYATDGWHNWCPVKRYKLPDYVPDVVAGSKAPMTLSHWKISAIKLALILERRPVTRTDIKNLNMSPSRWLDKHSGYLVPTPAGYVASNYMPDLKRMHPVNWYQIMADMPMWGTTFGLEVPAPLQVLAPPAVPVVEGQQMGLGL